MNTPTENAAGKSSLPIVCAWLYLILLPLSLPLRGPLFVHDLIAPVLVVVLLSRGVWREYLRFPKVLLPGFLGLAALATACHARGGRDIYDLAIMGYMAVVFAFFSHVRLKRRHLAWYGALVLGAMWAVAAYQMALGAMRSYGVYEHTTLGFIAKRFFFTFAHPNLAGSFYALPVACLLVGLAGRGQRLGWREILIGLAALAALLIPLGLTVSKHMLLSVALIAGAVVVERDHAPTWRWLGLAAALAVFVLFYLTVLFPFFPLQPRFPFFNHATWGMYTTHQAIYWRILFRDFSSVLIGVGPEQLREIYPTLANPEHIRAVLDQYQQGSLTESFCTYMDSHNEYLNTGTAFGLPALLALVAFWVSCAVEGIRQRRNELLLFFVVALLCCCLWDDLASKRWVWVALGMLVGTTESSREERI